MRDERSLTGTTTCKTVGGTFIGGDELVGLEEFTVGTSPYIVNCGGFKIKEYCAWNVFSSYSFAEKAVKEDFSSVLDG